MKWLSGAFKFTLPCILLLLLSCVPVSFGCPGSNQPPSAIIDSITPGTAAAGTGISFTGHGTDPNGTVVAYRWRSSLDGEIGTRAAFEKADLSAGTHIIYFKVQDNNGAWSKEENKTINITAAGTAVAPGATAGLPVITFFNANPAYIPAGASSLLSWNVTGAAVVSIDNGIGDVAAVGSQAVTPAVTTGYLMVAKNAVGVTTATTQVIVAGSSTSPLPPPPPAFAVTGVTAAVDPPYYSGACPKNYNCSAVITASGPGTVTYRWERSDGGSSPAQTLYFAAAGSQAVTTGWPRNTTGTHWVSVRTILPNEILSNQANFTLNCVDYMTPPATGTTPPAVAVTNVSVAVDPQTYSGGCPKSFTCIVDITVNAPCTVTYIWVRSDGTSPQQTLGFTTAGTKRVTTGWPRDVSGQYWVKVRTLTPNVKESNQAILGLECR